MGGARFVTRAKNARSDFSGGQGRVPRRPMPREGVVATIRVRGGRGGGIEEGGGDMVGGWDVRGVGITIWDLTFLELTMGLYYSHFSLLYHHW